MSYTSKMLLYGPSLLWPLNSASGANDASGNARNGTGAGGITIGGSASSPINGETNSTDFAGDNDRITSTYVPFTASSTRTFMGWAYRDASATADVLFGGNAVTYPVLSLSSDSTNVVWNAQTGGGSTNTWTAAWPGNTQWVHWALVVIAGTEATLYINGSLVSRQANAVDFAAQTGMIVGSGALAVNPFDGKMAYFAVFEHGLTDTEIKRIYEFGIYGKAITPVAWHPRQFA